MDADWQQKLKGNPVLWLLESNPWTRYRTLIDILEVPVSSPEVKRVKSALCLHPRIQSLVEETSRWFPQSITRHNDSKAWHYGFMALAELGMTKDEPGIDIIIKHVSEHLDDNLFAVRQQLPESGKGFTKTDPDAMEWHALPCDSPIITYSLLLAGIDDDRVTKSVTTLKDRWNNPQGWFCHFFFVDGQFKKLQAGCPMAGLMALEMFSQVPDLRESIYARNAFKPLKFHKEYGKSIYYFGRSKRFWTFKYPFVWYNALYLADVLTRFKFLKGDTVVKELVDWIENAQDEQGRYRPTSMWMPYKGWEFADKKQPSPWITLLCCRILKRWYEKAEGDDKDATGN